MDISKPGQQNLNLLILTSSNNAGFAGLIEKGHRDLPLPAAKLKQQNP